jgi:hypothetical protein
MLKVRLIDRARKGWDWEVFDEPGVVFACGRQKTRFAAKYQAERALFQLLATSWKRSFNTDSIKQGKTRRV